MSDPIANRTLELACTVGAPDDAIEAIEDGADVNYQGGAPLFQAIMNRNREMIHLLLDHGAVADSFIAKKKLALVKDRDDLIEELISCAPHNPRDVALVIGTDGQEAGVLTLGTGVGLQRDRVVTGRCTQHGF